MKSNVVKRSIKKVCCLALVAAMSLSLVACGGGEQNPTKNPTKPDGNAQSGSEKTLYNVPASTIGHNGEDYADYDPYAGIEKYKGTTVKFATWIDHEQTEAAKVFRDFEEKYGIKVELVYCSQNKYVEELLAHISAGNAPDVFVDGANFPYTLNIAQDFSVTGVDLNEPIWSQAYINSCSVGDKVYGVNTINSVWASQYGILYNRELMEANGIKTPAEYYEEGNWTWETMKYVMQQVDALGEEYYGGSIPDIIDLIGSMGVGPVSYDYKTGTFTNNITDPRVVKACQYYAELQKEGLLVNQEKFSSGKVGLIIKDPYAIKRTGYYRGMDGLDLDYTYMPNPDENTEAVFAGNVRCYGIVKGAKNPEAAGYFLRYFLDAANYDVEDTFVSIDVAEAVFEMNDKIASLAEDNQMFFNHSGIALLTGQSAWTWVGIEKLDPSQVAASLSSHSNEVDAAIQKAHELIDKMR